MTRLTGKELLDYARTKAEAGVTDTREIIIGAGYVSERRDPEGNMVQCARASAYSDAIYRATYNLPEPESRRNLNRAVHVHDAGLINVSKSRVSFAGFLPGDTVTITSQPGRITITRYEEDVPS